MSKLKLTYFNIPGLAEAVRLAFYVGGVDFEDERLAGEQFGNLKPTLPYGSLPVLTLPDGEVLAQSNALLRYAGRLSKLYPEDNLQATRVDELIDATGDVWQKVAPIIFDKNPETKKQGLEKVNTEILPQWVGYFEKRIEKYGKGFAVGDKLTIADLKLAVVFGGILKGGNPMLEGVSGESIQKSERLSQVIKNVFENERVQEWNKNHNQN